ncbi:hypothetical protein SNEBB_008732 [Seison nebaliae]|nr:hypothetical protein SNEBB_008732 [Seison nebaliae]
MNETTPKVLSIQSHVVHGYVGNRCAVFPLQLNGFEVDVIHTVQLSTHTQYPEVKGRRMTKDDLNDLVSGLTLNKLIDKYSYLITGYISNIDFIPIIIQIVEHNRKVNKDFFYLFDPVLGDNDRLYAPKELIPLYRNKLLKYSTIITPNQYECQWLSGMKLNEKKDIRPICQIVKYETDEQSLYLYVSENGKIEEIKFPRLNSSFTGTGDLFTSLFLVNFHQLRHDVGEVCIRTLSSIHRILKYTNECVERKRKEKEVLTADDLELKLIECRKELEYSNNKNLRNLFSVNKLEI